MREYMLSHVAFPTSIISGQNVVHGNRFSLIKNIFNNDKNLLAQPGILLPSFCEWNDMYSINNILIKWFYVRILYLHADYLDWLFWSFSVCISNVIIKKLLLLVLLFQIMLCCFSHELLYRKGYFVLISKRHDFKDLTTKGKIFKRSNSKGRNFKWTKLIRLKTH